MYCIIVVYYCLFFLCDLCFCGVEVFVVFMDFFQKGEDLYYFIWGDVF